MSRRLCEKHLSDAQKYFGVSNSYVSFFNELVQIVQHIVDAENLISCSFEIHAGSEGKSIIEDERRQLKRWKNERLDTFILLFYYFVLFCDR